MLSRRTLYLVFIPRYRTSVRSWKYRQTMSQKHPRPHVSKLPTQASEPTLEELDDLPDLSASLSDSTTKDQQAIEAGDHTENDLHRAVIEAKTPEIKTQPSPEADSKAYKDAHTILMIYEPPYYHNQLYVPIKLSLCPTINNLFATVAQAWDLSVDQISALQMRFPGFEKIKGNYDCGVMRLKRDMEGPFECFLDAVENGEYWNEEGGECRISVKIDVQRKKD
ncbi:MAG: hypothetical protein Q9181_007060 [Wetmoreana brouardii]